MGVNYYKEHRVHFIRQVSKTTYVLRFDRHGINFIPGQHILLGVDEMSMREYSVYSSVDEDFFEVLIKEIPDGLVSKQLHKLKKGDPLFFETPVGFFRINQAETDRNFLFVASGTGISPFHSIVKSYPFLNYILLHGIPDLSESYDPQDYLPERLVRCTSKSNEGEYIGRVTGWLSENNIDKDTMVYLCGNSNMIMDARDILLSKKFPPENIHTEVYF